MSDDTGQPIRLPPHNNQKEMNMIEELVTFARAAKELEIGLNTMNWIAERESLQTFALLPDKTGGRVRRLLRQTDLDQLKAGDGWRRRAPRLREE